MPRRPCTLEYATTGGDLRTRTLALSRREALDLVDASYQLKMLENKACRRGRAVWPISFGGKLIVSRRRP